MKLNTIAVVLTGLATLALAGTARAQDRVRVEPAEAWTNFFAGREAELHVIVTPTQAIEGRAAWVLTVDRAPVARREVPLVASPDKPARLTLRLPLPPVRDGVVLPARLTLEVQGPDGKPLGRLQRSLWLFPDNPFAGRAAWLRGLKITLHDPARTTAPTLKAAGIPFDEAPIPAALAALDTGLALIGEGASFKDEPGLLDTLTRLGARGVPVLCLAPADGRLDLAALEWPGGPRLAGLTWRRGDAITRLDPRLDAAAWPPRGRTAASTLTLATEDGRVIAQVGPGGDGWPWLEAEYERPGGKLVVFGFGLIAAWPDGPTPRYLLAALLEHLTAPRPGAGGASGTRKE